MVIIFGPPGAGKSVQGQLVAARHGWRWLSTGQLLRDAHNPRLHEVMVKGELVSNQQINNVMAAALKQAGGIDDVILDGYPRNTSQAEWLLGKLPEYNHQVTALVYLETSDKELYRRLQLRGRADDTPENIAKRSKEYKEKTQPVIDFLKKSGVCSVKVNGEGSVGAVFDRVEKAVQSCIQS